MITEPMNCLILLAVGYDLSLKPEKIQKSLRPLLCRILVQAVAILAAGFFIIRLYPGNEEMLYAVLLYMSAPTTFSMQAYVRDPEGSAFVSTTNSLYVVVTILVYAVCAATYTG